MQSKYVEILEQILKALCAFPEDVRVNKSTDDRGVLLNVKLHAEDYGKVIGKGGATIEAIRQIVRVVASLEQARASVLLIDDPRGARLNAPLQYFPPRRS